jgi:hypothetical protein
MKFTHSELASIEATLAKLQAVTTALAPRESTDAANVRGLVYIIAEMRNCAKLIASDDRAQRVAGYDRLDDLITK